MLGFGGVFSRLTKKQFDRDARATNHRCGKSGCVKKNDTTKRLPAEFTVRHSAISWSRIGGVRNRIVPVTQEWLRAEFLLRPATAAVPLKKAEKKA
jgi:hypothetical protein